MIVNMKPLGISEVKGLVETLEEGKTLKDYLKKFKSLSEEEYKKLADELQALENLKLKSEYVIKILDFLPKNQEELNKIFIDVSLDERETNEILAIVGRY